MPMIHECAREDCRVLTMGELCLEHERELELTLEAQLDLALRAHAVEDNEPAAA
jgi:hypothetical protein